jgi:hypothetical protein
MCCWTGKMISKSRKQSSKKTTRAKKNSIELFLRVLGYKENDSWMAHCLEMDLVGSGRTFQEALRELSDLIDAQICFSIFKGNPSLLYHPAPPELIETYTRLNQDMLNSFPEPIESENRAIASIPIARPKLKPKPKFHEFAECQQH